MEFFKRGNATEDKSETAEMLPVTDDFEVVELGADDSAIQSAKAAVEAMKNNSYFGQPTVDAGNALPPTTPVFTSEQLGQEMPKVEQQKTMSVQGNMAAPTSAAEAVARLNTPPAAVENTPVQVPKEEPTWKVNMDAVDAGFAEKAMHISDSVKEQLAQVELNVQKQLQELKEAMHSQLQFVQDSVRTAVKEAGSSTEQVVAGEKVKLTSAFDLEKKTMNANFDKKLQELQEKHDAEIRDLKEVHNQEITQMKDDQINALDKMKQMYGDQMEEMQTAYREKNAALKREMDQYKEKLDILMLERETTPFSADVATSEVPVTE